MTVCRPGQSYWSEPLTMRPVMFRHDSMRQPDRASSWRIGWCTLVGDLWPVYQASRASTVAFRAAKPVKRGTYLR